jgi:hypothetical protein
MSGYIFSFHLPMFMVRYLGVGGNLAFIRGIHAAQQRTKKPGLYAPESLACTLGPSEHECKSNAESNGYKPVGAYGASVLQRARSPAENFCQQTGYYRDGAANGVWKKSIETIVALQNLTPNESTSPTRRRSSSSASSALFSSPFKNVLGAPATVVWGVKDLALGKQVCLDGIGDYLVKDSEVILLNRSGHWTPLERESRAALARVIGLYAAGGEEHITGKLSMTKYVSEVYEGAAEFVKK